MYERCHEMAILFMTVEEKAWAKYRVPNLGFLALGSGILKEGFLACIYIGKLLYTRVALRDTSGCKQLHKQTGDTQAI